MTSSDSRSPSRAFLLPLILVLAAAAFRWAKLKGLIHIEALENFSPWMALAFTGTLVFSRRVPALAFPLLLIGIDLAASGMQSITERGTVAAYACFALAAVFAGGLRGKTGVLGGLLDATGCSLVFYLVTNTVTWFTSPLYAQTLAGWTQALTTGLPGFPPTLAFLRNSLVSDLGFSLLLFAAYNSEAAFRQQQRIPLLRPAAA